jgi:hypothetical protein
MTERGFDETPKFRIRSGSVAILDTGLAQHTLARSPTLSWDASDFHSHVRPYLAMQELHLE